MATGPCRVLRSLRASARREKRGRGKEKESPIPALTEFLFSHPERRGKGKKRGGMSGHNVVSTVTRGGEREKREGGAKGIPAR